MKETATELNFLIEVAFLFLLVFYYNSGFSPFISLLSVIWLLIIAHKLLETAEYKSLGDSQILLTFFLLGQLLTLSPSAWPHKYLVICCIHIGHSWEFHNRRRDLNPDLPDLSVLELN